MLITFFLNWILSKDIFFKSNFFIKIFSSFVYSASALPCIEWRYSGTRCKDYKQKIFHQKSFWLFLKINWAKILNWLKTFEQKGQHCFDGQILSFNIQFSLTQKPNFIFNTNFSEMFISRCKFMYLKSFLLRDFPIKLDLIIYWAIFRYSCCTSARVI